MRPQGFLLFIYMGKKGNSTNQVRPKETGGARAKGLLRIRGGASTTITEIKIVIFCILERIMEMLKNISKVRKKVKCLVFK